MNAFVAMLGVHAGMSYGNSPTAIGVSLGTVFFLFIGIATCMRMMIAFSGSFHLQIQPFLAFMLGGGVSLYAALGSRNPSLAIGVASMFAPIATFWAITSFVAVHAGRVSGDRGHLWIRHGRHARAGDLEFDVATGRTTPGDE